MDNKKYYDEYISRNFDHFAVCKKSPKNRVFIDMDGVLCEYRPEAKITDMMSSGYFASLAPRSEMVEAVKGLIKLGQFDVYVLSAVISECAEQSKREKTEWLDKYIPEIDAYHRFFTICGTSKSEAKKTFLRMIFFWMTTAPILMSGLRLGAKL